MPVRGIGEVVAGDDVAALIRAAATAGEGPGLRDGDVVVVASKVVAKAAGRTVTPHAGETAEQARRRLALEEAVEVLAETSHVVVVRTATGQVCANAGIDASNTPGGDVLLLPADADADAVSIRQALADTADVGVVVADTFGRAWREGQTDIALGVAGLPALRDERGTRDREGRLLSVTLVAVADQLAGAADLVRDKAAGVPVVLVRGTGLVGAGEGRGADLVRDRRTDLFPHGRGWLARRLATGEGPPTRHGPPDPEEWDLVVAAVRQAAPWATTPVADDVGEPVPALSGDAAPAEATAVVEGGAATLTTTDGVAAGVALTCLLDLGYPARLEHTAAAFHVVVDPPPPR